MAAQGSLQFPNGAAAVQGIEALTHTLKRIELRFGDDLRVDPLTADFAVVAASFSEVLTDSIGPRHAGERLLHRRLPSAAAAQWVFRNAHWSLRPAEEAGRG